MNDETPKKRPISEIGHLFLSSMRDRQMGETPRPRRTPPAQRPPEPPAEVHAEETPAPAAINIDLTPEKYAKVFAEEAQAAQNAAEGRPTVPPVTAVLAANLGNDRPPFDRVKQYARELAIRTGRVGLIELDVSSFRLICFDPDSEPDEAGISAVDPAITFPPCYDPRQIAEAIEEMNWDVQRWLLLVSEPRTPEAKTLLRKAGHWVLLTTCDHDGVIASYRLLKGLAEGGPRPRLSLAIMEAPDAATACRVRQKLRGVCEQFLGWTPAEEPATDGQVDVAEHLVMFCRPDKDKTQTANAPQWALVSDLLTRAAPDPAAEEVTADAGLQVAAESLEPTVEISSDHGPRHVADLVVPPAPPIEAAAATMTVAAAIAPEPAPAPTAAPAPVASTIAVMPLSTEPAVVTFSAETPARGRMHISSEVIDLPGPANSPESILDAVLHQQGGDLVECPVRAPMCGDVRLAVARDHTVVLMAVARQGLAELKGISQAYRWLAENRNLIGMAIPQLAIDIAAAPQLRLFVDQADLAAEVLRPLMQSEHVTVLPYRTLRWGGRTGLLLDAA